MDEMLELIREQEALLEAENINNINILKSKLAELRQNGYVDKHISELQKSIDNSYLGISMKTHLIEIRDEILKDKQGFVDRKIVELEARL
jgi:hypothetical protein